MIDGLKPYPEYKESGVPWLGPVPGHWGVRRMRHVCEMRVSNVDKHTHGNEAPVRLANYVDVYKNERITSAIPFMTVTATNDEVRRFRINRGDVLITKDSEDWKDIGVPALVEYEASDLLCGYHLAILRPRSSMLEGGYLLRALQAKPVANQFHVEANGVTRYALSQGAILGVSMSLPPLAEQAAIVRFLDHANWRIEKAIRAKRKIIALLNEQKQAIIHRAVTRGLDPSVPLKDSGIPWLGQIPSHWEVLRVGSFARVGNGSTPSRSKPAYWTSGSYPWLNSSQVNRGFIDSADQFVTKAALKECHLPRVSPGSVLIAITGQGKTRGTAAILGIEATINQHIAYIRPRPEVVSPEFLCFSFGAAYKTLRAVSEDSGSTKGALTCEELKRFKVVIPLKSEQARLVEYIQVETVALDALIFRVEREISLLREYRTRLIADVVTGKVDVREAAARLPDEADNAAEEPIETDTEVGEIDDEPTGAEA